MVESTDNLWDLLWALVTARSDYKMFKNQDINLQAAAS